MGLMLTLEDGNTTLLNGNKLCCTIKVSPQSVGKAAYKKVIKDVSKYAKCTFSLPHYKYGGPLWSIFIRETPFHDRKLTLPVVHNFNNGAKKVVRTDIGVWLKRWIRGKTLKLITGWSVQPGAGWCWHDAHSWQLVEKIIIMFVSSIHLKRLAMIIIYLNN